MPPRCLFLFLLTALYVVPVVTLSAQIHSGQEPAWMEDLRDDDISGNCQVAIADALAMGRVALPHLRQGLRSADWQQRLLSAVLMARIGCSEEDTTEIMRVLLTHLDDNRIRGDAHLAKDGILHLGKRAYPALVFYRLRPASRQGQHHARFLFRQIHHTDPARKQVSHEAFPSACASIRHMDRSAGMPVPEAPPLIDFPQDQDEFLALYRAALRDDDHRFNANFALSFHPDQADDVVRLAGWPEAHLLPEGGPNSLLYGSLDSPHLQERRLAVAALIEAEVPPTDAILREAAASLQHDDFGSADTVPLSNAHMAGWYLQRHSEVASPYLLKGLKADNLHERLRSAAVLARSGHPQLGAYVPVLLQHLMHNRIPEDGTLAARSLAEMGPRVLPWLPAAGRDAQEQHFLDVIRRTVAILERDPEAEIPFSRSGGLYTLGHDHRTY